ncbi:MAG: agmatine deiminase family protein [Muribaculaceae bacterium]|nr:agmatine deiminase family protein [Muribaculaceae bacterium]
MYRFPAEWEHSDTLLIAWPHENTDWNYMLDEVQKCYLEIVRNATRFGTVIIATPEPAGVDRQLRESGIDVSRCVLAEVPTNDTWARDFGPITLLDADASPVLLDFKFNGWGLKFASDKDNLITRRLVEGGYLKGEYVNRLNFVLEGGSIESDGKGLLLTTSECLLSPNRNGEFSREQIENYLIDTLHVSKVLWLDHGALAGDDTDSHIDTLARLAPESTILYVKCDDPDDEHFAGLEAMENQLMQMRDLQQKPFRLLSLPLPDAIYDENGERLPATHANFLIFNKAVLVPTYAQPVKDSAALATIAQAFPEHEIIGVDCRALIRQHGSLHCVTMQLPEQVR